MLREFTKKVGRYSVGAKHDYPKGTWDRIAHDAGMKLDSFTKLPEGDNPVHQSSLKGTPSVHKRLGGTQ